MIEFAGITKSFSGVAALRGASLNVEAGELLALLGPSGCGKTTLLRIAAGYEQADAGSVRIGGCDMAGIPPEERNIGMVFQNYALFPHMTVLENAAFGLRMRGVAKREREQRAREALAMVRVEEAEGRRPAELSGGQQQRVALARVLVIEPAVLLLDEPLVNLDRNIRLRMREEIRALQKRLKIKTILVTHDQEEALVMADRIAVMNEGVIEQVGRPLDLCLRPASAFVSDFLG